MEVIKDYENRLELKQVRQLRQMLEMKIKECEFAQAILVSSKPTRKIYRIFDDLLIEISKDEAIEHLERKRLLYKNEIEKLKRREKELMDKLAS